MECRSVHGTHRSGGARLAALARPKGDARTLCPKRATRRSGRRSRPCPVASSCLRAVRGLHPFLIHLMNVDHDDDDDEPNSLGAGGRMRPRCGRGPTARGGNSSLVKTADTARTQHVRGTHSSSQPARNTVNPSRAASNAQVPRYDLSPLPPWCGQRAERTPARLSAVTDTRGRSR
jgi:hypothetical protein